MRQVAWVGAYRRDLMADFRAVYRLSWAEAMALDGPEFYALAHRASAYPGVMAARVQAEEEKDRRAAGRPGARRVEGSRKAVQRDRLLSEAISFA